MKVKQVIMIKSAVQKAGFFKKINNINIKKKGEESNQIGSEMKIERLTNTEIEMIIKDIISNLYANTMDTGQILEKAKLSKTEPGADRNH